MPELIKFTYELKCFKDVLDIKEFYPEKNAYESKAKKDYGNKAYKEGKDLDALYLYSQVKCFFLVNNVYHLFFRLLLRLQWEKMENQKTLLYFWPTDLQFFSV